VIGGLPALPRKRPTAPKARITLKYPPRPARGAVADIRFQLPAFERLAKIICGAYTGKEITDLLKKAGFETVAHDGGTKWRFLYAFFERMQREHGPEGVLRVLKAACSPQERLNRSDVRGEVNECLSFYGLRIGEDGEPQKAEKPGVPSDANRELFLQRNYHRLVMEHARENFLRGDYFGAVSDCCREFERFVRKKSGLEMSGRGLMSKALGTKGSLEMSLPRAASMTRNDVQEGIMHMCMGVMASARNPTAHETRHSFPIGRDDALDMLGVISHLCRQVDRMGPRAQG